ncbi:PD-(D/E)XK nuclease-like domain-containing protein [Devosia riboflavina]|uniref:PD-(D/E)XK nuclease-like domain-containing protein n=1 Tax=Devosia riboflavina TaxID=46914 RepID=UPI00068B8330|nr:PD-(D/E)XK nuclease-like domain-containing protein [Devosia riboflavina]
MTELRKVEDGEIITSLGYYDMSNDWYHRQCTEGPSLSSTGIRRLLRSPAEFWKHSELNPNRAEEPEKEAYVLGRAAHHLALGEADFGKHFVARPETLGGEKWHGNRTVCKDWLKARAEEGRAVLSPTQVEQIRGMAGVLDWQKGMTNCGLANTPLVAQGGALSGEIERSLIWEYDGVWLKARPDAIPGDSNDFADLKTTSSGVEDRDLSWTVMDRGYFVQAALVGMGSAAVLGRHMEGFHLVFVDTGNTHAVSIRTLLDEDIIRGERAVFTAIQIFKHCMKSGYWPGPTASQADAQPLSLPDTGRQNFDKRLDMLERQFA